MQFLKVSFILDCDSNAIIYDVILEAQRHIYLYAHRSQISL